MTNITEPNWGYGRIAFLLKDGNSEIYGVTAHHVTSHASDGIIYMQYKNDFKKCGVIEKIGRPNIFVDVNVFKIECKLRCYSSFPTRVLGNDEGHLFNGTVSIINHDDNDIHFPFHIKYGEVASIDEHKANGIDTTTHFLVKKIKHLPFFEEGDSGSIVRIKYNCTNWHSVGMITGGFTPKHSQSPKQNTMSSYVLCLRLGHAMNCIHEKYKKTFHPVLVNRGTFIKSGLKIWVKIRMEITRSLEPDIVLHEHLINLCDWIERGIVSNKPNTFWTENEYMLKLSRHVNSRKDLEPSACITSDHKCYLHAIMGCDYVYSGNFDKAENQFKIAVKFIAKTSAPTRHLCKVITYITWLLLKQDKLHDMKTVLAGGFRLTLECQHREVRIHDSIGYLYFDKSRYFIQKGKPTKALQAAYKAMEYFESYEKCGVKSTEKQALAWTLIARLNLNCGEFFETIHHTKYDIKEAETYIRRLEKHFNILPIVQKVSYYLVTVDLYFRKGNIVMAFERAKKCKRLSEKHNLKEELLKSFIRYKYFEKAIPV